MAMVAHFLQPRNTAMLRMSIDAFGVVLTDMDGAAHSLRIRFMSMATEVRNASGVARKLKERIVHSLRPSGMKHEKDLNN